MTITEAKEYIALYEEYWAVRAEIETMVDKAIRDMQLTKQNQSKQSKQSK